MPPSLVEHVCMGVLAGIVAASFVEFDSRKGEPQAGYGYFAFMTLVGGFIAVGLAGLGLQDMKAAGLLICVPVLLLLARPKPARSSRTMRWVRPAFALTLSMLWIGAAQSWLGVSYSSALHCLFFGITTGFVLSFIWHFSGKPDWNSFVWIMQVMKSGILQIVSIIAVASCALALALSVSHFGAGAWYLPLGAVPTFTIFAWPQAGREEVT